MEQNNLPVLEQKPEKSNKAVIISAVAFVSILVLAGIFLIVWNYQKKTQKTAVQPSSESSAQQQNAPAVTQNSTSTPTAKSNKDDFVEWYPAPKEIPAPKIYKEDDRKYTAWEVGKFIVGDRMGDSIILVMRESTDPGGPAIWRFIRENNNSENIGKLDLLIRYSNQPIDYETADIDVVNNYDNNTVINSLEYPGILYTPKGERMLKEGEINYESIYHEDTSSYEENILFDSGLLKKAFADPVYGDFYTTDSLKINENNKDSLYADNGFYVKAPDGTIRIYSLAINFLEGNDVPNIAWNDGTKNSSTYMYQGNVACGSGKYFDVVDKEITMQDLTPTGKTSTGDIVYEPKDKNNQYLKDFYKEDVDYINSIEENWLGVKFKKETTYDQFVAAHPVFYWKDSFGRIIRFISLDYLIKPDGCGKPVIYLYPEKEEKVSVKVAPSGGLTKTEPEYGNGWNVIADPMSRIKNLADGKTYPYLFWEGNSKAIYQMSRYGFVVERDNLENLLNEKLAPLGLNEKEIGDFKEYWLPKMLTENKPYYFVTFVPQRKIDEIAPLEINPQPNTIIRVLMDYKGLDEKIDAPGYEIKTPERKGFTAVEWGGMLK